MCRPHWCSQVPCDKHVWQHISFWFSDENCRDKYYNCNVVVQARLCVYTYYQTTCCASCTRGAQRHSGYWGTRWLFSLGVSKPSLDQRGRHRRCVCAAAAIFRKYSNKQEAPCAALRRGHNTQTQRTKLKAFSFKAALMVNHPDSWLGIRAEREREIERARESCAHHLPEPQSTWETEVTEILVWTFFRGSGASLRWSGSVCNFIWKISQSSHPRTHF